MSEIRWWKVVTWKHANCGGESLVFFLDGNGFAVCTGPNPWGCGSWGAFPESAIISVRDLRGDDSWTVSGSTNRWTAEDLLSSLRSYAAYRGRTDERIAHLEATITHEEAANA